METWTQLAQLPMEPYFSMETADAGAALNERIGALLAERGDLDCRESELAQADAASLGAELRRRWRNLGDAKADILAKEVALRGELRKLITRRAADAHAAADELQTKMDAERDRLAAALVKLGFVEAAAPTLGDFQTACPSHHKMRF